MTRTAILLIFALILSGVLLGNVSHKNKPTEAKELPMEYSKDFVKPMAWRNHEKMMEAERNQGNFENGYPVTQSSGK